MKRSLQSIAFVTLTSSLVLATGIALGAEHEQSDQNLLLPHAMPIEQAIALAREQFPGRVLEAELEHEDGKAVFEITIASSSGDIRELAIDAQSGQVLDERRASEQAKESEAEDDED